MKISVCIVTSFLTAWFVAGCARDPIGPSPPPADLDPVSLAVRTLSGSRTRIVWLQDVGDGTDYLARGEQLRLMGFDTDDGRGERVILNADRNIAKPMFTSDGNRIVFSDRHNGTMHLMDWEGGEPERLGQGFALTTWRDPETGIEWLFYARDVVDDGKILPTHEAIYRMGLPPYPFNRHTLAAHVRGRFNERESWRQTHVSEDSYQMSADGRFASAPFPWPTVGVQDIPARRWNLLGRGCWVALSPDNSYLFWVLDGAHRNLTLFHAETRERWAIPINRLPDTDRYEVYHPRWSNHPRIMAITGPYKVGDGAYRLPGGGKDVEIWLGQFAENHREIEHWVRLTYNNFANFYPDVWIEIVPTVDPAMVAADTAPFPPDILTWPSSRNGLLYVWEHAAAQNEVKQADTGRLLLFRPEARLLARFKAPHSMGLTGGYFMDELGPALTSNFTLEFMTHAAADSSNGALIIGYGPDTALWNQNGRWLLRWEGRNIDLGSSRHEQYSHLVFSVSSDSINVFVDGTLHHKAVLDQPLSPRPAAPLFFGGHPDTNGEGSGALSHIAVYNRPMDEREARINHRLALEHIERQPVPEPREVRARVVEQSAVPTLEDIAPYRRALVVNTYEISEGHQAGERLLAAHWAILDGRILDTATRPVGRELILMIAPFDDHPELEGERLAMDGEEYTLDLYYDLNL